MDKPLKSVRRQTCCYLPSCILLSVTYSGLLVTVFVRYCHVRHRPVIHSYVLRCHHKHFRPTYILTNLYSAKHRENESDALAQDD